MTKKMQCPVCNGIMLHETRSDTVEYKGVKKEYSQPGFWCQNEDCGEAVLKGEDSATADLAYAALKTSIEGV